jgi:hypothetical protein
MNEARARELFPQIRDHSALATQRLTASYNVTEKRAELLLTDDITGEAYPVAIILEECPYEHRWIIEHCQESVIALRVIIRLLRTELERAQPAAQTKAPEQKAKAALSQTASITCQRNRVFHRYLQEEHGLERGADIKAVRACVREAIDITSFNDLNDPETAKRWHGLWRQFQTWMGQPR